MVIPQKLPMLGNNCLYFSKIYNVLGYFPVKIVIFTPMPIKNSSVTMNYPNSFFSVYKIEIINVIRILELWNAIFEIFECQNSEIIKNFQIKIQKL